MKELSNRRRRRRVYQPGPEFAAETPLQTLLALGCLAQQIRSEISDSNNNNSEPIRAIAFAVYQVTTGESELNEALRFSAEQARAVTGADGAAIALDRAGTFVCCARSGEKAPELGARLNPQKGISGECVRTGAILRCGDTETDGGVNKEACRELGIRSMIAVPIYDRRSVAGVLEVFSGEPRAFTDRDLSGLELLSALITHALQDERSGAEELRQHTSPRATAIESGQSGIQNSGRGRIVGTVLGTVAALALIIGAMEFMKRVSSNTAPDATSQTQTGPVEISGIEFRSHPDFTTVKVSVARTISVKTGRLSNPERIYFDLLNTRPGDALGVARTIKVNDPFVSQILLSQPERGLTRVALDVNCRCDYGFVSPDRKPYELSIVVQPTRNAKGGARSKSQSRGSAARRF